MAKPPPNVKQVAQRAGVSLATVSRVFNGTAPVATPTRKRVVRAAESLGYQPDFMARGLRGCRTSSIGILWNLEQLGSGAIVRRIADYAQQRGCSAYVADTLNDAKVVAQTLDVFIRRKVDAVVIECHPLGRYPELADVLQRIPAVLAVTWEPEALGIDQIVYDRKAAAAAVADHFMATGRRRPMMLVVRFDMDLGRIHRFAERLRACGMDVSDESVVVDIPQIVSPRDIGPVRIHGMGERVMEAHFGDGSAVPDALWCGADELAVGVMQWCKSKGLRVPEDVAVVGYDDNALARHLDPPLASIARRDRELAEMIGPMLWSRLENPDTPIQQERLVMQFVCRKSAGLSRTDEKAE